MSKSRVGKISKIFLKKFCFSHQGCIYWNQYCIKNTVKQLEIMLIYAQEMFLIIIKLEKCCAL